MRMILLCHNTCIKTLFKYLYLYLKEKILQFTNALVYLALQP